MASAPRIVAELGRPETADETSARKAASSLAYRSSQTFRNLIAALLVTVALVVVVVLAVPRGSLPEPVEADVAAAAAEAEQALGRTVVAPETPDGWRANVAGIDGGAWRIGYAPPDGFVRIVQGFDVDAAWTARMLSGSAPTGTVTIAGIAWDEYRLAGSAQTQNVSYALATTAGTDTVLVYGATDAETAAVAAAAVADQIRALREDAP